jgi:hypothetical protein
MRVIMAMADDDQAADQPPLERFGPALIAGESLNGFTESVHDDTPGQGGSSAGLD